MPSEIERKFLVISEEWRSFSMSETLYVQGYLCRDKERTVRVRIAGDEAFLTIKGAPSDSQGISRAEYEYPIPVQEAQEMLDTLCFPEQIRKHRSRVMFEGHVWEVDVFHGANEGLVLAEVELSSADETVILPPWVGKEVSTDSRYTNAELARNPLAFNVTNGA